MLKTEKKKKLVIVLLSFVTFAILLNGIFAFWWLGYNKTITGEIMSEGNPMFLELDFSDSFLINTQNSSQVYSDDMTLNNVNGETNMTTNLSITKTDLTAGVCGNYLTDCDVSLNLVGFGELQDGTEFPLLVGGNNFELILSCVKHSCEQDINVTISLQEIIQ